MSTKQKRAIFMIGVTAAVYVSLRYLLPLVLPFFISYGLARLIWPLVSWTDRHTRIPEGAAIAGSLFLTAAAVCCAVWWVGGLAGRQLLELLGYLPQYTEQAETGILWIVRKMAGHLGVDEDVIVREVQTQLSHGGSMLQETLFPAIADLLPKAAERLGTLFTAGAVASVSAVFFIRERARIKEWMEKSVFRREIRMITKRLGSLARAFFRTQGLIFLLVTAICTGGLWLLQNRYFLLLGVLIGILDMLPVFGTGTVLIPWALLSGCMGDWRQAAGLLAIYFVTYYLREFLEAHMMGKQLGIGSLEMMGAMYIGLKLFGIGGLFLGPIGWILIKEIDKTLYLE